MVAKFYSRTRNATPSDRDQLNWRVISAYNTVCPFVKSSNLPSNAANIPDWTENQLRIIHEREWNSTKAFYAKNPDREQDATNFQYRSKSKKRTPGSEMVPNRIPKCQALSNATSTLNALLSKSNMTEQNINEVDNLLL